MRYFKEKIMKKNNLTVFAVLVLCCLCIALVACNGEAESLELENYRTDFKIGDEFETGADFAVYAVYKNGKKVNVTEKAEIQKEKGFDMNVAGDYMITVSYGNKKEVYTIFVADFDNILRGITIDSQRAKKEYAFGETISYDGLVITEKYENAQGRLVEKTASVEDFTVSIVDKNGRISTDRLTEFGPHSVIFEKNGVSASYTVNVNRADTTDIRNAIELGAYGKQFINGGSSAVYEKVGTGLGRTTDYQYIFGNNYTYVKEDYVDVNYNRKTREFHYGISSESGLLELVTLENGASQPSYLTAIDAMDGVPYMLWYYSEREYGVESAVKNLYAIAENDPNKDLSVKVDSENLTYEFSFSYLQERNANTPYFFENEVKFELYDNYGIKSATVKQTQYTANFSTDSFGKTTLNKDVTGREPSPSYIIEITVTQEKGERTALNPYLKENMYCQSFELTLDGKVLEDGAVITAEVNETLYLRISNVLPVTTDFNVDLIYFSDGETTAVSHTILYGTGFSAMRSDAGSKVITVTAKKGGEWDFIITSENVEKHIIIKVTGEAPTEMTTEVYNGNTNNFAINDTTQVSIGKTIYFRATVNEYANDAYSAIISGGNGENVTLEETTKGGEKCWSFIATAEGTYVITMISDVAPRIKSTLTVTVVDTPDLEEILSGTYTAKDVAGGEYTFTFTPNGETTGTVSVTYTDANNNVKTETFTYSASLESSVVELTHVSGDVLGVDLFISVGGLELEDRYGAKYALTK